MVNFSIVEFSTLEGIYSFGSSPTIQGLPPLSGDIMARGYAPYVEVVLDNLSTIDNKAVGVNYQWNFGDYYNESGNIINGAGPVKHRYIMPGIYTISLLQTQFISDPEMPDYQPPGSNDLICPSLHNQNWNWDSLVSSDYYATTWNETRSTDAKSRTWNDQYSCFGKYCRDWAWRNLLKESGNAVLNSPVTWRRTKTGNTLEKTWAYEPNTSVCEDRGIPIPTQGNVTITDVAIQYGVVEVLELPPKAILHIESISNNEDGSITVAITPQFSRTGSFPIEEIIWDVYGDETKLFTLWRSEIRRGIIPPEFAYNGSYNGDINDPRNYTLNYTYKRTETQNAYYPAITIIAANTKTEDNVCIALGPIPAKNINQLRLDAIHRTNETCFHC
jgi:hypothetical protein